VNLTEIESLYSFEYQLLNETLSNFVPAIATLSSNISTINSGIYVLQGNLSSLSTELFQFQQGVNGTAQVVYGVPMNFVRAWSGVLSSPACDGNVSCANNQTNSLIIPKLSGEALAYYSIFFNVWNASFQQFSNPNNPPLLSREQTSVNQTVTALLSNPQLNSTVKQIFATVADELNVTTWDQANFIGNLTVNTLASQIPSNMTNSLGISARDLLLQLYDLGPSPADSSLGKVAVSIFEAKISSSGSIFTTSLSGLGTLPKGLNFSVSDLLNDAYNLGSSPSLSATWYLASGLLANATVSLFASSPLLIVNSTSLHDLLLNFNNQTTTTGVQSEILNEIANQSYSNYPYILSQSITKNLVSSDNSTMLLLLSFSSVPSSGTINTVHRIVHSSGLASQGKVYVTGSSVLTQDLSEVAAPAIGTTTVAGGAAALVIAGLLFLAPLAAFVPLLIAGIAIAISLSVIEFVTTVIEKTTISFVTPFLTILLMLGLAVDYSVLQLRRTKEERLNGRSKEESVALSVKWAGQAVITAALTVIVAYIILAVARIPFFGPVGTSIAIGVSILLAISITLLPSLELSIGDRMYWPNLRKNAVNRGMDRANRERLYHLTDSTLRNKVAVVAVISLFAAGSFYIVYRTPTGIDLVQLLPNFESNQGLTALTNSFGGAAFAPTQIVVTTTTPIVYGNDRFNQTLLNQIEAISSAAANTSGVVSVSGPTRPFGSQFDYSQINNNSSPTNSEYITGILQDIGINNKTALITVGLSSSPEGSQAISTLRNMESNIKTVGLTQGVTVYYGGETQSTYDAQSFINGLLPEVVIILAIAVYIILFFQLRSAFIPFRLVLGILSAAVFALALLSIAYYHILQEPIVNFSILFVVVTMLGVGTDYDIFVVTRIKEEVLNGKSDSEAIKSGISKVWVTAFGLALILSSVFGSLLFSGIGLLSELGLTVASAVVLDVACVILFFVPALMGLAVKYNWWPSKIKSVNSAMKPAPIDDNNKLPSKETNS
jgi:putative drug exporter of the RND superfamily